MNSYSILPQFGIRIVHKKLVVSQIFCTFMGELQQVTNLFDMTTDYKVTELFCIIDEFCKHFEAEFQALLSVLYQGYDEVVFPKSCVV